MFFFSKSGNDCTLDDHFTEGNPMEVFYNFVASCCQENSATNSELSSAVLSGSDYKVSITLTGGS